MPLQRLASRPGFSTLPWIASSPGSSYRPIGIPQRETRIVPSMTTEAHSSHEAQVSRNFVSIHFIQLHALPPHATTLWRSRGHRGTENRIPAQNASRRLRPHTLSSHTPWFSCLGDGPFSPPHGVESTFTNSLIALS